MSRHPTTDPWEELLEFTADAERWATLLAEALRPLTAVSPSTLDVAVACDVLASWDHRVASV